MKRDTYKVILLSSLIIISIIQTYSLWLGDVLGHKFFIEKTLIPIKPESIWLNTGGEYTKAYKVSSYKNEYENIILELQNNLSQGIDINEEKKYNWKELFNTKGIIYDYNIEVVLGEVMAKPAEFPHTFDTVLVSLSGDKLIYLINQTQGYYFVITFENSFTASKRIFDIILENENNMIKYQPSIKDLKAPYLEGNIFLANISPSSPLVYVPIKFQNNLEDEKDKMLILDRCVDDFFDKPIMKEVEINKEGIITFTEPMKAIVKYFPKGSMEYVNLNVKSNNVDTTRLEAYNVAMSFIQNSSAFLDSLKESLYLENVTKNNNIYTFNFNIMYENHKVVISNSMKEFLNLEYMISIQVRDNEIVSGKWAMLDITPINLEYEKCIEEGYASPIDTMYSLLKQEGYEPVFKNVECVYTLEGINMITNLRWGIKYEDKWYYPVLLDF
ncbi:hypothetical protein AN639_03670 [Candidatus Epulonipiscium fishelsonii]|uniref:Uncharacterized protein n=1 Tax=Candidatus Epulonipiscium fishelsonii TaxID=77094 RepID=A0ACC8X7S7_9FIRM|nr:hypothetical protein AN396_12855 [Epulopiscium sp. SCG-B11WGA-EpuloA1]ONI41460.1 hypothetical protein AN639_03670 [Epulopiscium sp. SCG-B05WGA-EpuloA1]